MAGQIEAKVSRGDLVAAINLEANKTGSVITMKAGHFIFEGENFGLMLPGPEGWREEISHGIKTEIWLPKG